MSSKPEPDSSAPDVVEHSAYTETGDGPAEDTFAYLSATPMVAPRNPPSYVTFEDEQKAPAEPTLDRSKLARKQPPPEEPPPSRGLSRRVQLSIFAVVVGLVVVAGLVTTVFRSSPPVVAAPEAPAKPEAPATHDGVPVEKGLKRKALPPKKR